jgi:uncharacterized protein (TIGR02449 family)
VQKTFKIPHSKTFKSKYSTSTPKPINSIKPPNHTQRPHNLLAETAMHKPLAQLDHLDEKLNTLIHYVDELHNTNRELREQVKTLQSENNQMAQRMSAAQSRIDEVITQLERAHNDSEDSAQAVHMPKSPL